MLELINILAFGSTSAPPGGRHPSQVAEPSSRYGCLQTGTVDKSRANRPKIPHLWYGPAPVNGRSRRTPSLVAVVAAGALATALLPALGGADTAPGLRARAESLGRSEQGALLELYALESSLGRAQRQAENLRSSSTALAERAAAARRSAVNRPRFPRALARARRHGGSTPLRRGGCGPDRRAARGDIDRRGSRGPRVPRARDRPEPAARFRPRPPAEAAARRRGQAGRSPRGARRLARGG